MDEYCDPMLEPTAGLHVYLEPFSTSSEYPSSTKFSAPLGFSKTDVSLYNMQPSMTGVEAWSTTLSTIDGWSKDGIETILSEQQADIIQQCYTTFFHQRDTHESQQPFRQHIYQSGLPWDRYSACLPNLHNKAATLAGDQD